MLLGFEENKLEELNAIKTAEGICNQPAAWLSVLKYVEEKRSVFNDFLNKVMSNDNYQIVFTGTATSEYTGNSLVKVLQKKYGGRLTCISSNDLVSSPYMYIDENVPTLIVTFSRSGNTTESVGAMDVIDKISKKLYYLNFTCNEKGKLVKEGDNILSLVLPQEANDKSFVITTSYSAMYLCALLLFDPTYEKYVEDTSNALNNFFEKDYVEINKIIATKQFDRIMYLGSDCLKDLAEDAMLKTIELSVGKVASVFETPMAIRHGTKCFIDSKTLVVMLFSDNEYTNKYELDIHNEIKANDNAGIISIVNNDIQLDSDCVIRLNGCNIGDSSMLVSEYAPVVQMISMLASMKTGNDPDNPFKGKVSRVVEGVKIYEY